MSQITRPERGFSITKIQALVDHAISSGVEKNGTAPRIFFRADDIGYPSRQFTRLIEDFTRLQAPLCLAFVPSWTTPSRLETLETILDLKSSQWCLHQHGYTHRNHQLQGKKGEFGTAREDAAITSDLRRGRARLQQYLGKNFYPVFTPPWNRCSNSTIKILKKQGFFAISRSLGADPPTMAFRDFQVTVDLHTRREKPQDQLWAILKELENSLAIGLGGIMIHHQRMKTKDYLLLEILLERLAAHKKVHLVHFKDLLSS